jgi:hypothetical protein
MRRNLYRTIVLVAAILAAGTFGGMAVAQETTTEVPSVFVIKNVNVWNGTGDTAIEGLDVLVVGNKIRRIAKAIPTAGTYEVNAVRKTAKKLVNALATENTYSFSVVGEKGTVERMKVKAVVIDGKGGFLIPGLMDSHQHVMIVSGVPDYVNRLSPYYNAYETVPHVLMMLL